MSEAELADGSAFGCPYASLVSEIGCDVTITSGETRSYPIIQRLLWQWICASGWLTFPLRRRILSFLIWVA